MIVMIKILMMTISVDDDYSDLSIVDEDELDSEN